MRRRTLLGLVALSAAVGASACTGSDDATPVDPTTSDPTAEPTPTTDEDPLRRQVARDEQQLLARYAATIAAFPSLDGALADLADQHRVHLSAVLEGAQPEPDPPAPTIPTDPASAVASLIEAERAAATARTDSCALANTPDLVRLLALIASSEASHAEFLTLNAAAATPGNIDEGGVAP